MTLKQFQSPCRWINSDENPCSRLATAGSDHCTLHSMAVRIVNLYDFDPLSRSCHWAVTLTLVPALAYFNHAYIHFIILHSTTAPETPGKYDPYFAVLFLGVGLVLCGKSISLARGLSFSLRFTQNRWLWSGIMVIVAFLLVFLRGIGILGEWVQFRGILGKVIVILFCTPFLIFLHTKERTNGYTSIVMIIIGLIIIFVSGFIPTFMQIVYKATGKFDQMAYYPSNQRSVLVQRSILCGIATAVASLDALIALCLTGKMLTLKGVLRSFDSAERRHGVPSLLQVEVLGFGLIFVLIGQGAILREMLLPWLGGYPLDYITNAFVKISGILGILAFYLRLPYLIIVLVIRKFVSRWRKALPEKN